MSRGGRNTKIHAVVDGLGNPVYVSLSSGNLHDGSVAEEVLSNVSMKNSIVMGDKAYAPKLYVNTLKQMADHIVFLQNPMNQNLGSAIGGNIKNVIWWNAFFRNSSNSDALQLVMINWLTNFWPLFILLAYAF